MAQLTPYLHFKGNCKEAMEFYKSILDGDLHITPVAGTPAEAQMPENQKDLVMHSVLTAPNMVLMASDMVLSQDEPVAGNRMSVTISNGPKEEIKNYYTKLAEGGKIVAEWQETFFGSFGRVTDKFGIDWMFQGDPEKQ